MTDTKKRDGPDSLDELVSLYKRLGWREEHHFPEEYVLLIDSRMNKVRIYENGDVWRSDPNSGEYIKIKANMLARELFPEK